MPSGCPAIVTATLLNADDQAVFVPWRSKPELEVVTGPPSRHGDAPVQPYPFSGVDVLPPTGGPEPTVWLDQGVIRPGATLTFAWDVRHWLARTGRTSPGCYVVRARFAPRPHAVGSVCANTGWGGAGHPWWRVLLEAGEWPMRPDDVNGGATVCVPLEQFLDRVLDGAVLWTPSEPAVSNEVSICVSP